LRDTGATVGRIVGTGARAGGASSTSARSLAFAAAGLVAMAVVGASPGSPYQPTLTPKGRPRGPLRDLATALHLDVIHGDPQLAIGVVVALLATAGFLLLLREAFRGSVGVIAAGVLVVGAHVLLLFEPLLFSNDVYSYAYYGRIAAIYGGNPYVQTPLDHTGDLLWNFVGPRWVDTPAVYGPAWTSLSALMSRFLPYPADHVEAYRYLAVATSLATCAVIVWTVRRLWPERTAFALLAFGANPVIVFHSVASGHNDLLVALAIAGAFALVAADHRFAAIAVLTLGALVKATAVLPLLLLIVWCVGTVPRERRRRTALAAIGLPAAIGLAFSLPYIQLHDPTLGMLELAGHEGWLAPASVLARGFDALTFHTLGWVVRLAAGALLVGCLVVFGREIWRRARAGTMTPREQAAAWGWALVLLTLLGPVLLPWYVVWAMPLVWVLPRVPRIALIGTGALLGVTLWSAEAMRYPGGFTLNVAIGDWLVVPVLMWFVLIVVLDLRSRIGLGWLFEDGPAPDIATASLEEPDAEQRVADPTGQDAGEHGDRPSLEVGSEPL
jgi:hypothetical protein